MKDDTHFLTRLAHPFRFTNRERCTNSCLLSPIADAVARASAISRVQQGGRKQPPAKKTRGRGARKTVAL